MSAPKSKRVQFLLPTTDAHRLEDLAAAAGYGSAAEYMRQLALNRLAGGLGGTVEGVQRDLEQLRSKSPAIGFQGIAAAALALARELDDEETSATAKASCVRALADTLAELRKLVPAGGEKPTSQKRPLDELSDRRAARRAGSTAT